MAERSIDVDRIVREVLAELRLAADAPATAERQADVDDSPGRLEARSTPEVVHGELVVSSRVVTMADVDNRLDAVKRLVVPPQAVVTPAVRDELQRNNVTLAYAQAATDEAAGPLRLMLLLAATSFDPTALIGVLGKEGIEVQTRKADCLIAACDALAGELAGPGTLGLLLTSQPAAALCLANRLQAVRAVSGTTAVAVAAGAASVGANLLVADPAGQDLFKLKQMASEFCRSGPRECPEVFRERLGL